MGLLDKFKKKDGFDDLLKEPVDGGWGNDFSMGQPTGGMEDPFASDPSARLGASPMDSQFGGGNSHQGMPGSGYSGDKGFGNDDFNSDIMGLPEQSHHDSSHTSASALNLSSNFPTAPMHKNQGYGQQGGHGYGNQNSQNSHDALDPNQERYDNMSSKGLITKKDVELILTKLDLIKTTLQHLDARISNIEHKIYNDERRW